MARLELANLLLPKQAEYQVILHPDYALFFVIMVRMSGIEPNCLKPRFYRPLATPVTTHPHKHFAPTAGFEPATV